MDQLIRTLWGYSKIRVSLRSSLGHGVGVHCILHDDVGMTLETVSAEPGAVPLYLSERKIRRRKKTSNESY
jgi:hypothetical protein